MKTRWFASESERNARVAAAVSTFVSARDARAQNRVLASWLLQERQICQSFKKQGKAISAVAANVLNGADERLRKIEATFKKLEEDNGLKKELAKIRKDLRKFSLYQAELNELREEFEIHANACGRAVAEVNRQIKPITQMVKAFREIAKIPEVRK
jgi:hypothetical protein